MAKAELFDVEITALGAQGDGVGERDGTPVFVPGTVPGDVARVAAKDVRRNGIYADLVDITKESADRTAPACQHFGTCGGCQLQFLKPDVYAAWVRDRTAMALAHHGFDAGLVRDPIITPQESRRRVALKALRVASGVVLGFNERQSHQIVDVKECPIARPELTRLFAPLRALLAGILPQRMAATVHMTVTASGVDLLIDAAKALDLADREALVDFANTHDIAAVHWQDQGFLDPVAIRREAVMDFAGARVPLPPAAFIQASDEGEAALVKAVVDGCAGHGRVADLFSGIGTFTFPLAKEHQVLAAEGAKNALDAMQAAANVATGFKQIVAKHRDLFRRPLTTKELEMFEAVVFDPPRAGAKDQVEQLATSSVSRIVAVSCNPNTFSRDARTLADGGYELESVQPVDQFLWSPHMELVGIFSRK
ncbi:23S rRNA (uracil(1939)-C(5))-methyltransferase RlmD [Kordiimonas lacus]|uniref:23S rRNA (Uracil1939-C5)-methyltransferase n=1 Tax=Kordiimonas lacus TaxID=637679 RepID=A0A1G7CH38_9PROT|nr:23S rRNA (uracil(1939)-C(5))-methyltransferase RlmD [Kordiimonas lacus]SDE38040.1 23S rRNA (uracil1939-C5)-methyltransferase [Kordiimonas lacus]